MGVGFDIKELFGHLYYLVFSFHFCIHRFNDFSSLNVVMKPVYRFFQVSSVFLPITNS